MTKKSSRFFIATILSLCLFASAALCFTAPATVKAEDEPSVTLSDEDDFVIEDGVLLGLSDDGEAKIPDGSLYSVKIPDDVYVYRIDTDAFGTDDRLYGIYIPDCETAWSDHDGDYYYVGSFEIDDLAFYGCTSLVSVHLPDGLTTLGECAFAGCTSLQSINIPGTLNSVPSQCFQDCESLATVTFDNNVFGVSDVYYIGESAFDGTGLTSVVIPGGIQTIGANAYANNALTSVFIPASVQTIGANAFGNIAFDKIQFECSIGLILGAFPDAEFDGLDFENGSYMNNWGTENKAPLNFTENSTVFLPHAEDVAPFVVVETMLKFSDASILVSPDKTSYDMVTGLLKDFIQEIAVLADDAPLTDYDGSYLNGMIKSEVLALIESVRDKHFFAVTLTFSVTDTLGNTYEVSQDKLATDDYPRSGADPRYTLEMKDGKKSGWKYDENYDFPTEIQGVTVDPNNWSKVGYDYPDWHFNVGTLRLTGDVTLTQTVAAAIDAPTDEEIVYSGAHYEPSAEKIAGLDVTRITDADGHEVNSAVDAGTYTVYVALKEGCVWSDNTDSEQEKHYELVITKKSVTLKWFYGEEDVTQTVDLEIAYSAAAADVALFKAEIVGENEQLTVGSGLTVTKQGVAFTASILTDGVYVFTPTHKNFDFGNSAYVVRVKPLDVDLSQADSIAWTVSTEAGALSLSSGTVYIAKQGENIVAVHTLPHPGVVYSDIKNVTNAIVRYTNKVTTISLVSNDAYTASAISGNAQTACGVYTVSVTLTANDNYKLTTSLANDFEARGLTVTIEAEGKQAVITKTWYIIELENELLNSADSIAAQEWVVYEIAGWTYGDKVTVTAPRLVHGDEGNNWQSNNYVQFRLERDGVVIVEELARSRFAEYINDSMPVGNYRLVATVSAITLGGTHMHWWNNDEHDSADTGLMAYNFTRTYEFTVAAANISINSNKLAPGENGYDDYEWELTASADKETLFAGFASKINAAGVVTLTNVTRKGYWAAAEADVYYGGHVVTYNLARMNNETYLEASNNNLLNRISSEMPDTYTVYFQIAAPNHNNLTDTGVDGRYAYFFTVAVFKKLDVPTVIDDGLIYTGSKVLPELDESDLYEAVWSDSDAYVSGGKHTVSFKLYDSVHYRWKGVTGDTVSVTYEVAKAENVFTVSLNMLGWNYQTFDAAVNNIRAAVRFLDAGQSIHFRVVQKGGAAALEGLSDFTIDGNGKVNETVAAVLNELKTGEYTLYATIAGTGNYLKLERDVDFVVSKAMNTWADGDDDLALPSWIVGKYSETDNPIVVNAAHGIVNIIVTDIDGNEYYNSITGVNKLNDCEVGKYLLKAWVDETEDYAALAERTFTIEVLEKVGLPWWATLLITVGALLLAALIIFILWKKGVFQIMTEKIVVAIRTKASVDATIASIRAAKMMEEGRQSVAEAKRRERIEALQKRAKELREMPPEERAAHLDAKAQVEAEKAEKSRQRSEAIKARADKFRGKAAEQNASATDEETAETEVTATETPETPANEVPETAATEAPETTTDDE